MTAFVLHVHKDAGVWVLDDREHGLVREPLLFGMDRLIDQLAATLPAGDRGFDLSISEQLTGDDIGVLIREEADANGHWYRAPHLELRGWMGNRGLLRYFSAPPATIYYSARPTQAAQAD